ncbi:MAG TPA: ATP-binding cassette domain-containing protein [Caulobacteraceae bacterium]|nr:ATP-binding cassette domain-containing protein [Caulobacteraceae bacterium]
MNARAPILALKGVSLADGPRMLFDQADLGLEPRVKACLVGANGAGKSTLLRMLAGLTQADSGERFATPGVRVSMVAQEPAIMGETLLDYAAAGGAERHRAAATLEAFGLAIDKRAQGLSGGETRRAALARAFAEDPDVLLLDEPTNHLDILAIETLEAMLGQSRAAALTISHDRAFLERTTQRCFWLEDRKLWKLDRGFGAFDDWSAAIAARAAEEARRLDKSREREQRWMERGVTARRARNEGRRRKLLALRAEKADRMRDTRGALSMGVDAGVQSGQRVLEAKGLSKAWPLPGGGERVLLKDFSTRVLRGDRVAVVGPNGAGKTTLIKLLLGELKPDAGTVILGANLNIAYLDQARAALAAQDTLWEVLAPDGGDQIMVRGRPRHIAAYAKDFLFRDSQLRQPVASLSGGERNRLLLARALATAANLLVLDEPTNDLDMDTLDLLEDLLADYDGTLILVSHDRDFIDRLATSTIALDGRGRVVETPGGWGDFQRQIPHFLDPPQIAPPAAAAPARGADPAGPKARKLSYKDARRLLELETLVPAFEAKIRELESRLADPNLFSRDREVFDKTMAALDKARQELEASEEEWLALEEKKDALSE